jgi:hypothetical protein
MASRCPGARLRLAMNRYCSSHIASASEASADTPACRPDQACGARLSGRSQIAQSASNQLGAPIAGSVDPTQLDSVRRPEPPLLEPPLQ